MTDIISVDIRWQGQDLVSVSGPPRRVFTRAKETDRGVRAQLHAHGWMKQQKTKSGDGGREWKNDDLQWWMEVREGVSFLSGCRLVSTSIGIRKCTTALAVQRPSE